MEYTPIPWTLEGGNPSQGWRIHARQGPIDVCPAVAYGLGDATLIVSAVNAHEALLAALKEGIRLYESYGLLAQSVDCGAWINAARDAVALTEK